MKILALADIPGWIVDRITDKLIEHVPAEFTKAYYACIETDELLRLAEGVDLIHYGNWDIARHWPRILDAGKPVLVSVRSHRFPESFRDVAQRVRVHAISRALAAQFPGSIFVPDGLMVEPRRLRVGFAGKPGTYKGTDLIAEACRLIDAEFVTASDVAPADMPAWYQGIDVYCCASENEGFGAPVLEALACRRPVVSTRCGAAWEAGTLPVVWANRTADALASALSRFQPAMAEFSWPFVGRQMAALYGSLLAAA